MVFKKKKERTKSILKFLGTIIFFLILIYFLEGWGLIGLLVFILGIFVMRCWNQRAFLKNIMQQTEMIIWGKPLDKDMWNRSEMKNTKLKIVWGKNKFDWDKYIIILVYPALLLLFIGVMWDVKSVTIISMVFFSMIIIVKSIYFIGRMIKKCLIQKRE